jgi:hypothetical protein
MYNKKQKQKLNQKKKVNFKMYGKRRLNRTVIRHIHSCRLLLWNLTKLKFKTKCKFKLQL